METFQRGRGQKGMMSSTTIRRQGSVRQVRLLVSKQIIFPVEPEETVCISKLFRNYLPLSTVRTNVRPQSGMDKLMFLQQKFVRKSLIAISLTTSEGLFTIFSVLVFFSV